MAKCVGGLLILRLRTEREGISVLMMDGGPKILKLKLGGVNLPYYAVTISNLI